MYISELGSSKYLKWLAPWLCRQQRINRGALKNPQMDSLCAPHYLAYILNHKNTMQNGWNVQQFKTKSLECLHGPIMEIKGGLRRPICPVRLSQTYPQNLVKIHPVVNKILLEVPLRAHHSVDRIQPIFQYRSFQRHLNLAKILLDMYQKIMPASCPKWFAYTPGSLLLKSQTISNLPFKFGGNLSSHVHMM